MILKFCQWISNDFPRYDKEDYNAKSKKELIITTIISNWFVLLLDDCLQSRRTVVSWDKGEKTLMFINRKSMRMRICWYLAFIRAEEYTVRASVIPVGSVMCEMFDKAGTSFCFQKFLI